MSDNSGELDRTKHRAALMAAAGGPRDLETASRNLAGWLEGRLGKNVAVSGLRVPTGAGLANETLLFEAAFDANGERQSRGLVARVKPEAVQLFPDPDFEGLFKLLQVLHDEKLVKAP